MACGSWSIWLVTMVNAPRSLTDIAQAEMLPLAYLEQLAKLLREAEPPLLVSTRGAHGGYRLSRSPGTDYDGRDFARFGGANCADDLRDRGRDDRDLRHTWHVQNSAVVG